MMRVSPPEEERELPGPHASMSVTRALRRNKNRAIHPPNDPAPITATWTFDCILIVVNKNNVTGRRFGD